MKEKGLVKMLLTTKLLMKCEMLAKVVQGKILKFQM